MKGARVKPWGNDKSLAPPYAEAQGFMGSMDFMQ